MDEYIIACTLRGYYRWTESLGIPLHVALRHAEPATLGLLKGRAVVVFSGEGKKSVSVQRVDLVKILSEKMGNNQQDNSL